MRNGVSKFWLKEELEALGRQFRVSLDGHAIPFQDHDEELRHVGYWLPPKGETAVQQQKVIDHCLAIDSALTKARTAGPVL